MVLHAYCQAGGLLPLDARRLRLRAPPGFSADTRALASRLAAMPFKRTDAGSSLGPWARVARWTPRSQRVSKSTVNNIWQAHNLKPHRVETFKLSRDPKFLEKMTDGIGLYLNPPQQAIVLSADGTESNSDAVDRTPPGLPLKKGRCGTMTHDYKRNGTTTLFAALEILQGKVIGQCRSLNRFGRQASCQRDDHGFRLDRD